MRANADFGCDRCYGQDAERVWAHDERGLVIEQVLEDDSHFIVQLRRCADCAQRFVWIFTEAVDWEGGDDAQHRVVIPVSEAEAQALTSRSAEPELKSLVALGRDRRYLRTDWPTGTREQIVRWATGEHGLVMADEAP